MILVDDGLEPDCTAIVCRSTNMRVVRVEEGLYVHIQVSLTPNKVVLKRCVDGLFKFSGLSVGWRMICCGR